MTIGFFSPLKTVRHLIQEQVQELFFLEMIFFSDLETFGASLIQKELQGYLEDRASDFFFHATVDQQEQRLLSKPFRLKDLLDQIKQFEKEPFLKIGSYFFDEKRRLLTKGENLEIQLREKEADFLLFLLKSPQQKADRQILLQHVWGYPEGAETHTLETHVYHLRQKIEKNPASPEILISDGSGGYRLIF